MNCGDKVSIEYNAIILLNVIPNIYKEVKMLSNMERRHLDLMLSLIPKSKERRDSPNEG